MNFSEMPTELRGAGSVLPAVVAALEKRAPYASAVLERTGGMQIAVNNREQNVTEIPLSQGLVLSAWNGAWFEEAATSDLTPDHIVEVAQRLASSVQVSPGAPIDPGPAKQAHFETAFEEDPKSLSAEEKLEMCRQLHRTASALDPRIVNVAVRYLERLESKAFVNRTKQLSQNVMRLRMSVQMFVSDGQQLQYDWVSKDATGGLELIHVSDEELRELCDHALALLTAEKVPPGMYDVVCSPDVSGVIAHEAFGHGVELDMFLKGRARSEQYLGEIIASPLVSILDDPSYPHGHGSYFFDDEGQLASPTYIIRNGVFERGISDLFSAHSLEVARSANGRRESFEHKIYTRMSNTFFGRGDTRLQDMIESVDHGVYLQHSSSGMEDPKGWGMQVTSHYGEEIRNGQLTGRIFAPIGITGYVPDILQSVTAVGEDFVLSGGTCGKGHKEWVPVSSGGPHLKLKARLG
jgi:TldD protein